MEYLPRATRVYIRVPSSGKREREREWRRGRVVLVVVVVVTYIHIYMLFLYIPILSHVYIDIYMCGFLLPCGFVSLPPSGGCRFFIVSLGSRGSAASSLAFSAPLSFRLYICICVSVARRASERAFFFLSPSESLLPIPHFVPVRSFAAMMRFSRNL